jgi:hypothetical protein
VTGYNLSSINVQSDLTNTIDLMNNLANPSSNSLVQLLSSGNQNTVGQVMSSLSQQFNTMNNQTINQAVSNGISPSSISISSLGSQSLEQVNIIC